MRVEGSMRPMLGVCAAVSPLSCTRIRHYTMLLLMLLMLLAGKAVSAASDSLDTTIDHLIAYVRESGITFKRNFFQHDSIEAAEHIERKYQHFRDDIDTPEEFIELCATRSLVTGNEYLIITTEGEEMSAGVWLNAELGRYLGLQGSQ